MNPKIFREAAERLAEHYQGNGTACVPSGDFNCPLRAIRVRHRTSTASWVEFNLARALFTALYRPAGISPLAHWWDVDDFDATLIALHLAECFAQDNVVLLVSVPRK